jgi:hypothetical protein
MKIEKDSLVFDKICVYNKALFEGSGLSPLFLRPILWHTYFRSWVDTSP